MKIAIDIDGTIDSAPRPWQSIMSAMKSAGHTVVVLTGTQEDGGPTPADFEEKANYLNSLGCGSGVYDQLEVLDGSGKEKLPELKADWCAKNGVDVLFDNDKDNAKAASAAGVELVLVPWASRQGGKRMAVTLEEARQMTGEERAAASQSFSDIQTAVFKAIMASPAGSDDLWIVDLGADYVIWYNYVTGAYWRTGYTCDADGCATLTGAIEPVQTQTQWVTVGGDATDKNANRSGLTAGLWTDDEYRKKMSSKEINDLPDSAFAHIEPGGEKDEDGKTTPRSLRHFPIHDAAHVRNALARLSGSPFGDKAKAKVHAAAKKFGIAVSDDDSSANSAAKITEMRQSQSYKDTMDLLEGACSGKFANADDGKNVWISDFTDEWVVYEIGNEKFQATYEVDGDTVTLGDPVAVTEVHTYTPMETKAQEPTGEARAEVGDGKGKVAKTATRSARSSRSAHRSRRDLEPRGEVRAHSTLFELRGAGEVVDNKATLHGIPIVYNKRYKVLDQYGEFRENMKAGVVTKLLPAADFDCRFLYNHDGMVLARSIAGTLECEDKADGLHVYPTIDLRSPSAMDLYVATESRAITQMSIGFKVAKGGDEWRKANDGIEERDIYEIAELNDVSGVAYPCSTETSITIARSLLQGAGAETRARLRTAYRLAGDLRAGRLTQADGERLMKIFEELYEVDPEELREEVTVTPITEPTTAADPAEERTRQIQQLALARSRLTLPKA